MRDSGRTPPVTSQRLRCTQCGARLEVASDQTLLVCDFCDAALAAGDGATVFHEILAPTVAAGTVPSHLRRFLASSQVVAGADRAARIGPARLEYFPFWAFTVGDPGGEERTVLEPAAPSALQGLQGLTLPVGQARAMSAEAAGDTPVVTPDVPLETAREWLTARHPGASVRRTVLTHVPLFQLEYELTGRSYRAAVDGSSGAVLPAEFPTRVETPFRAVAGLALAVFVIEGLVIVNPILKLAVYLVSAVPLLGVAWWTSRSA